MFSSDKSKIAASTRAYRKLHKWVAVPLMLFMFLVGATGILLGLKKPLALLPDTQKGQSVQSHEWMSMASLMQKATEAAQNEKEAELVIDRIDLRPDKGIAKFTFKKSFFEVQVDLTTGEILSLGTRESDWIEKLHDGSIIDFFAGWKVEGSKYVYSTLLGVGLVLLSLSGFYLWWNPRRIRRLQE